MFGKLLILSMAIAFSLLAVAVIVIQQTGLLIVDVQDRDGHYFIPIPMLLVNSALSLAPVMQRVTVPHEFQQHSDLMQTAATELLQCPDGPFVEVRSPDQDVLISKKGSNLVIDVKSDEEKIHVQIPIHATGKTLAKLAAMESR